MTKGVLPTLHSKDQCVLALYLEGGETSVLLGTWYHSCIHGLGRTIKGSFCGSLFFLSQHLQNYHGLI